ncbi:MAG: DEAD/DEAH box helicase [Myxococcales bacterium]|nr:DEAD/DEAH box helicase [Myxococcales bacterium]
MLSGPMDAPLELFHPAVARWFAASFAEPSEAQHRGWPAIRRGEHTLIAAPTGSGKTLAAFLCAIDELVQRGLRGELEDEVYVVYVSPLKALGNDIEKNLALPIAGVTQALGELGLPPVALRTMVRSGDTPQAARSAMAARPPHIVVTTPESLYIMLTSEGGRRMLRTARTLIVDEIHALCGNKRGAHLALSIERLEALVAGAGQGAPARRLVRIGLSATQRPIDEVARFLVGAAPEGEPAPGCTVVDLGHLRRLDLAIELPGAPLETVMSGEVWEELYERLAALVVAHKSTLVFVNTRRLCERLARPLGERLGTDAVTSHHGSLAREHRLDAEQRLKRGALRALVATSSLELGIDVGDVDLVCQIGATRSIAALLQRAGRSGHFRGGVPRARLFPLSRDELVECAALCDAVRRGELDTLVIPEGPLDILAQQMVAAVAAEEWSVDALYDCMRRAHPYRALARERFDAGCAMLADGRTTRRGRRGAHLHHDVVAGKLRPRRGARLAAITSGGAIPDNADYEVLLEPSAQRIGSVNEDFAVESSAGDVFQLGNASYKILRVEPGKVRVADARGALPSIPFWLGEAPPRSAELSHAVSRLRARVGAELLADDASLPPGSGPGARAARGHLEGEVGVSAAAAEQIVAYLAAAHATLGALPTEDRLVAERFFDETGGMHLVIHAPLGSRVNRAFGLALRKCFCRKFNFELQAAATEDALILGLGPTHSFPLEEVWGYLRAPTVRALLVQALLDAPLFATRWRWNASRALAVLRFRGGRRVPAPLLRMQADDLLTLVFPDQVACLENIVGDREVPDHPLVAQTIADCLFEAMDVGALERLLLRIAAGEIELVSRDLTEPSPLAASILNARPYAFLDDAPLEERRTQAVLSRRWLDPASAADLGALDAEAIARVRAEAWPEPRDADELHDALVLHGVLTAAECEPWRALCQELAAGRRATLARLAGPAGEVPVWVAAERLAELAVLHPRAKLAPAIQPAPSRRGAGAPEREAALVELARGRLEALGPVTAAALAASLALEPSDVEVALAALEGEGFVLRGRFTRAAAESDGAVEWCERRLLARIHRATLERLRREIEPVSLADFTRFLGSWQRVLPAERVRGVEGLAAVLAQLEGFEAPSAAWEADILPSRVEGYEPGMLDALCFAGRVAWARRSPASGTARGGPLRSTPIALMARPTLEAWLAAPRADEAELSPAARAVHAALAARGASFPEELGRAAGLLRAEVEAALGELVSRGLVASDGFHGLRALLAGRRPSHPRGRGLETQSSGRWSLLRPPVGEGARGPASASAGPGGADEAVAACGWALLRRWGVVFRRLCEREDVPVPWRDLLRFYRRLEARGEVRGGRFVDGPTGEQYALADAVALLRRIRRTPPSGELVAVSGADPLNLVGVLSPGARTPALAQNRVLYRDGLPLAVREGGEVRFLADPPEATQWELKGALLTRTVSRRVRGYLGNAV